MKLYLFLLLPILVFSQEFTVEKDLLTFNMPYNCEDRTTYLANFAMMDSRIKLDTDEITIIEINDKIPKDLLSFTSSHMYLYGDISYNVILSHNQDNCELKINHLTSKLPDFGTSNFEEFLLKNGELKTNRPTERNLETLKEYFLSKIE